MRMCSEYVSVPGCFQFYICTFNLFFILPTGILTLCHMQLYGYWQVYRIVYLTPQLWYGGVPLPLKIFFILFLCSQPFLLLHNLLWPLFFIVLCLTKCHLNGIKHYITTEVQLIVPTSTLSSPVHLQAFILQRPMLANPWTLGLLIAFCFE